MLTTNYLKRVTISTTNFRKLIAIRDSRWLKLRPDTQLKQHDNNVASLNVKLHATNKQNNSTLLGDIGTLLFWRRFTIPRHAWPDPTNTTFKGFLKLPNLHMLLKQKNPSLPRNLVLGIFGESLIVFSTKVNLL